LYSQIAKITLMDHLLTIQIDFPATSIRRCSALRSVATRWQRCSALNDAGIFRRAREINMNGRNVGVAVAAIIVGGGFLWWKHAQKEHDGAAVAAVRQGQEAKPCAVAVEKVAQLSQRTWAAAALACAAKPDPEQAERLSGSYEESSTARL
jgi:hypothetical protein